MAGRRQGRPFDVFAGRGVTVAPGDVDWAGDVGRAEDGRGVGGVADEVTGELVGADGVRWLVGRWTAPGVAATTTVIVPRRMSRAARGEPMLIALTPNA